MFRIIKKSLKTGVVTGRYPESTAPVPHVTDETKAKAAPFANSLTIREVDTGSTSSGSACTSPPPPATPMPWS